MRACSRPCRTISTRSIFSAASRRSRARSGEAQRLFSAAVKANPRAPQAWSNLGQALHALKRAAEALECLDKARALAPDDVDHPQPARQCAARVSSAGTTRWPNSRQCSARAPQHVEARINCGLAHAALGVPELALGRIRCGAHARARPSGRALQSRRRADQAWPLRRGGRRQRPRCLRPRPSMPRPGSIAARRWRSSTVSTRPSPSYGKALAQCDKDHADAHFNKALALLTLGDYRRGFDEYEWRWRRTGMLPQKSRGRPLWLGEYPLARKTDSAARRAGTRRYHPVCALCAACSPRPAPRSCSKCSPN